MEAKDEKGYTPLYVAADENGPECLTALLGNGAEVDGGIELWRRPLDNTANKGWADVFELLMRNGAKDDYGSAGRSEGCDGALPNVRALKFDVDYYKDRDRVSPGYSFVSPYGQIDPEAHTQRYQPYQIGPYIYDADRVRSHLYPDWSTTSLLSGFLCIELHLDWLPSPRKPERLQLPFRTQYQGRTAPFLCLQNSHDGNLGSGTIMGNDYEL
ncbi:hypothetical protein BJX65DRAFT_311521 [Aspergillus insuetus]